MVLSVGLCLFWKAGEVVSGIFKGNTFQDERIFMVDRGHTGNPLETSLLLWFDLLVLNLNSEI